MIFVVKLRFQEIKSSNLRSKMKCNMHANYYILGAVYENLVWEQLVLYGGSACVFLIVLLKTFHMSFARSLFLKEP